jgi:hypothetical protein
LQFRRGRAKVERRALVNVAVRMAEIGTEVPCPTIDRVAVEDLAVREVQVAADDQIVAGSVGIRQMIADGVAGDLGVAADGDATFHIAVESVEIVENESAEVVGDAEPGGWHIARLKRLKPKTGLGSGKGIGAARPDNPAG